ncbi:hypothetical protein F4604DRAFT_1910294 [Suillus subluteus]|nr:hypothetical protein F4604DRAFT_1910294 [Suillus subluteus]
MKALSLPKGKSTTKTKVEFKAEEAAENQRRRARKELELFGQEHDRPDSFRSFNRGYLLRSRYAPDWVPSWEGTERNPFTCEDGHLCGLMRRKGARECPIADSSTNWKTCDAYDTLGQTKRLGYWTTKSRLRSSSSPHARTQDDVYDQSRSRWSAVLTHTHILGATDRFGSGPSIVIHTYPTVR